MLSRNIWQFNAYLRQVLLILDLPTGWMSRPFVTSPIIGSSARQDDSIDSQTGLSDAEHSPADRTGDALLVVDGGASPQGSRPLTESSNS